MVSIHRRKESQMNRPFSTLVAAVVAAALIGAGASAAIVAAVVPGKTRTVVRQVTVTGGEPAASTSLSVNQIYERARKGVVEIEGTTSGGGDTPFGGGGTQHAQGSGFVYDSSGNVVTNQH